MSSFQPLVPMWLPKGKIRGLRDMPERPLLMNFETTTTYVRGEVVELTPTRAHIEIEGSFMLFNKVKARARFRVNDTVYALTGDATPRDKKLGIKLEFDEVTRTSLTLLEDLGYVTEQDAVEQAAECEGKPVIKIKRSKEQQRIVYRLQPPHGIDRRENHRYDLEAFAVLYVLDGNISLHCTILELSMTGCRLFSELPFTLAQNVEVEVQFNAKGIPFRLSGLVKLKQEQEHIIGLHFTRLSGRKRDQLSELIDELRSVTSNLG